MQTIIDKEKPVKILTSEHAMRFQIEPRDIQRIESLHRGIPSRSVDIQILVHRASLSMRWKRYAEAIQLLRQATELVELILSTSPSPRERYQVMEEHLHVFEKLTICLVKKARRNRELLREALSNEERTKIQVLKDFLYILRIDYNLLNQEYQISTDDIFRLSSKLESTLVIFRVTLGGTYAFLIYPDGVLDVISVHSFALNDLNKMMAQFEGEQAVGGWMVDYYFNRSRWLEQMEQTLGELYERLLKPVHRRLRKKLGKGVHSLVIVPNRALAILPLHACCWKEKGQTRYLIDEFVIRYAPSLTLLDILWRREQARQNRTHLVGVANPTGDLRYAEFELEAIERQRGAEGCTILRHQQATKAALLAHTGSAELLHLATHAQYNWDEPLYSLILLANGDEITLAEVIQLEQLMAWLVVLSACETSLKDFLDIADEQFGLATGFLLSGAPTVWASLWSVNDASTGLLMAKAYEHLQNGKSKAEALREAQLWLRELTVAGAHSILQQEIDALAAERMAVADLIAMRRPLEHQLRDNPDKKLFQHPYFWAAIHCVGV